MKKAILAASAAALVLTGCGVQDADVVSRNISTDADNFKINRRITFINGITDKYLMTIEGWCSIKDIPADKQLEVTCKTGGDSYKKHFLRLSDNVTYVCEQVESANVSPDHYKFTFKPEVIIPDIEIR